MDDHKSVHTLYTYFTCHSTVDVTTASGEDAAVREARSVGGQSPLEPVDCVLSEWSPWSRCDVCQGKRVRTID